MNKLRLIGTVALAFAISGCSDPGKDLAWCRAHEGELQQLGRASGVDYSALNKEASNHEPLDGDQETRKVAYWTFLQSDSRWLRLCREATVSRHGAEDWTAPPVPTRTPPGGGSP